MGLVLRVYQNYAINIPLTERASTAQTALLIKDASSFAGLDVGSEGSVWLIDSDLGKIGVRIKCARTSRPPASLTASRLPSALK